MESWSHFTYLPSLVAVSKESACNAGDLGLIPGMGRFPGEWHGNPLQFCCLENPHGQKNLVGCSPWGCKEWDTTEGLHLERMDKQPGPTA